jgi:hypothetical protein
MDLFDDSKLYTVKQVAEPLEAHENFVWREIRKGPQGGKTHGQVYSSARQGRERVARTRSDDTSYQRACGP